jgi:hypothetical protein
MVRENKKVLTLNYINIICDRAVARDLGAKLIDKKQIASIDNSLHFSLDLNLRGES